MKQPATDSTHRSAHGTPSRHARILLTTPTAFTGFSRVLSWVISELHMTQGGRFALQGPHVDRLTGFPEDDVRGINLKLWEELADGPRLAKF
jgi:hypothetical protein